MAKLNEFTPAVPGTTKKLNCWRCEFMNTVKREEEEQKSFSFSHTRLGMERTQEKEQASSDITTTNASSAGKRH